MRFVPALCSLRYRVDRFGYQVTIRILSPTLVEMTGECLAEFVDQARERIGSARLDIGYLIDVEGASVSIMPPNRTVDAPLLDDDYVYLILRQFADWLRDGDGSDWSQWDTVKPLTVPEAA